MRVGSATDNHDLPVRRAWLEPLVLVCVAFALYSGSLRGPWILDDQMLIARNPLVHRPAHVGKLWTSEYWASTGARTNLYRPLPMTTYALTYWFARQNTLPYHLTNVLLHCMATWLVWLVCGGGRRAIAAFAAALLFAVHPIHVEAVANVVGRSELLLTVFFLVAMLLYRRFAALSADTSAPAGGTAVREAGYALGIAAAMFAALLSKESAMALVVYFPVAHILSGELRAPPSPRRTALLHLPLAAAMIVYLVLRGLATTGITLAAGPEGFAEHLALSASAAAKDLQLILLPLEQKAVWQLPAPGSIPVAVAAFGLLMITVLSIVPLIGVLRVMRRGPLGAAGTEILLAVTVLGLSVLPLLHVVPNVIWVWERGLYLPSAALCWGACAGICAIGSARVQVPACCVLIALAAIATPRTLWLDRLYADDLRFWSYQAAHSPDDVNAMASLSESLLRAGRTDEALRLREQAYQRQPQRAPLVAALASLYLKTDNAHRARELLTSASLTHLDFHTSVQRQQMLQLLHRMCLQLDLPEAADRFLEAGHPYQ